MINLRKIFRPKKKKFDNSINVIYPYKYNNTWVFDDKERGLDKEPFVAGADTLLDYLTNNGDSCKIIFSKHAIPDYEFFVEKTEDNVSDGTMYKFSNAELHNHQLWLCPALFKYFNKSPDKIYFKIS